MDLVAYSYSKETGKFLSKIECDVDQLDSERVLIPAYATQKTLPETLDNQVAVFRCDDGSIPSHERDGSWLVVADNVGTEYWDADGTKHTIAELGVEVPDGALLEEPVIPPTVEEQTAKVQAQCKARIYAKWDADQQWNALAGADGYTADDLTACLDWVNQCRAARDALLADEATLVTIDVTDDSYWPVAS